MSDRINDGGSAFPTTERVFAGDGHSYNTVSQTLTTGGMTLRDWFAGQVLSTVSPDWCAQSEYMASYAYKIADAMLKERNEST